MGVRSVLKRLLSPFLKKGLDHYYRKPRKYSYDGVEVMVHPEVFPPHLTLSTKILLDFISEMSLKGKTFLELGCGSGIISLYARKLEAEVVATDINETALAYLKTASVANGLPVEVVKSDLFEALQGRSFDYILINPPYYPKAPASVKESAWFCGEDFEYFRQLFQQLPNYLKGGNKTYMILSEDCEEERISSIAETNGVLLKVERTQTRWGEKNVIYELQIKDRTQ